MCLRAQSVSFILIAITILFNKSDLLASGTYVRFEDDHTADEWITAAKNINDNNGDQQEAWKILFPFIRLVAERLLVADSQYVGRTISSLQPEIDDLISESTHHFLTKGFGGGQTANQFFIRQAITRVITQKLSYLKGREQSKPDSGVPPNKLSDLLQYSMDLVDIDYRSYGNDPFLEDNPPFLEKSEFYDLFPKASADGYEQFLNASAKIPTKLIETWLNTQISPVQSDKPEEVKKPRLPPRIVVLAVLRNMYQSAANVGKIVGVSDTRVFDLMSRHGMEIDDIDYHSYGRSPFLYDNPPFLTKDEFHTLFKNAHADGYHRFLEALAYTPPDLIDALQKNQIRRKPQRRPKKIKTLRLMPRNITPAILRTMFPSAADVRKILGISGTRVGQLTRQHKIDMISFVSSLENGPIQTTKSTPLPTLPDSPPVVRHRSDAPRYRDRHSNTR